MSKKDKAGEVGKAGKQSLSYKAKIQADAAADHLEALAKALRENHASIKAGDESIDLPLGSNVKLNLEAVAGGDRKSSLKLSLGWNTSSPYEADAPASVDAFMITPGSQPEDEADESTPSVTWQ